MHQSSRVAGTEVIETNIQLPVYSWQPRNRTHNSERYLTMANSNKPRPSSRRAYEKCNSIITQNNATFPRYFNPSVRYHKPFRPIAMWSLNSLNSGVGPIDVLYSTVRAARWTRSRRPSSDHGRWKTGSWKKELLCTSRSASYSISVDLKFIIPAVLHTSQGIVPRCESCQKAKEPPCLLQAPCQSNAPHIQGVILTHQKQKCHIESEEEEHKGGCRPQCAEQHESGKHEPSSQEESEYSMDVATVGSVRSSDAPSGSEKYSIGYPKAAV